MCTQLMDKANSQVQTATALKEEGNGLFKKGEYAAAMAKYGDALSLNPTDSTILSNACQTALKLDNLPLAKDFAERCVAFRPDWGKGWYRKGMVAMRQKLYVEAVQAFQQGLSCSPDDAELKRVMAEAKELAKTAGPDAAGAAGKISSKLREIQSNAWDIRSWHDENKAELNTVDLDFVKDITIVSSDIIDILRLRNPKFPNHRFPIESEVSFSAEFKDLESGISKFVMPSDPLLSALIATQLLDQRYPGTKWTIAWSFKVDPSHFGSWKVFHQYISRHRTYVWLVDRASSRVVDFLGSWEAAVTGSTDTVHNGIDIALRSPTDALHTCDDHRILVDLLDAIYQTNPAPAVDLPEINHTTNESIMRQRKKTPATTAAADDDDDDDNRNGNPTTETSHVDKKKDGKVAADGRANNKPKQKPASVVKPKNNFWLDMAMFAGFFLLIAVILLWTGAITIDWSTGEWKYNHDL
eukprot:jgi/Hompol1/3855/HPOL_003373-RA